MALKFERIDLVGLGELSDDRAHGRDVHVGAVQHDQGIALAGDFVIHLHAVDLDAVARRLGLGDGGAGDEQGCGNEGSAEHGGSPVYLVRFSPVLTIRRRTPPAIDMAGPKFLPTPSSATP